MKPAIFLDKDGTLIQDVAYNADASRIALNDGVSPGLRQAQRKGYSVVIVSNQPGVALGYFPESALVSVERTIRSLLVMHGVHLEGFLYCPHHPTATVSEYRVDCSCRKPKPGLFQFAAQRLGIDLQRSWMIGDILDDIEAGKRAGCQTILLDTGHETVWDLSRSERHPDYRVRSLHHAFHIVLGRPSGRAPQRTSDGSATP